jgi:hypothetical protein
LKFIEVFFLLSEFFLFFERLNFKLRYFSRFSKVSSFGVRHVFGIRFFLDFPQTESLVITEQALLQDPLTDFKRQLKQLNKPPKGNERGQDSPAARDTQWPSASNRGAKTSHLPAETRPPPPRRGGGPTARGGRLPRGRTRGAPPCRGYRYHLRPPVGGSRGPLGGGGRGR